jgi:hypothetical protein
MTLWAYFDESGLHDATDGSLAKLTVGGCVATSEAWEALSPSWSNAIANMGLSEFHMKDFEHRKGAYSKWSEPERKERLNILLDIIGAAKPNCIGFTNWVRPGEGTAAIYKRCAHDVLLELGLYEDEFAIVFAQHPEYGDYSRLHQTLVKHGYGKSIKSVTTARPREICPLQVADIVAYEIRAQERDDGHHRYPLRRLQELGCTFKLVSGVD